VSWSWDDFYYKTDIIEIVPFPMDIIPEQMHDGVKRDDNNIELESHGGHGDGGSLYRHTEEIRMELESLQVQAIFSLVETFQVKQVPKKLLYLTNDQAQTVDLSHMRQFLTSFGIPTTGPSKPKLVINFLESVSYSPLSSYDCGREPYQQPFNLGEVSQHEMLETEEKFALFLQRYLLPIAIETNAIVILTGAMCTLSRLFSQICETEAAARRGVLPFTVLQFASASQHWHSSQIQGTLANAICQQSKRWKRNEPKIHHLLFPGGPFQTDDTKLRIGLDTADMLSGATHYVVCDGKISQLNRHQSCVVIIAPV
jgi:hypothetical protein